jgi:hypothetical protein
MAVETFPTVVSGMEIWPLESGDNLKGDLAALQRIFWALNASPQSQSNIFAYKV